MTDLPGCFAYLSLTLLVENALEDENEGSGQFRHKLAAFLDSDQQFVELTGIAAMWRKLEGWLKKRASEAGDYRLLQLPDAKKMVQIGYTKRLTFPAKRDITFGRHLLQGQPSILERPLELIGLFEKPVEKNRTSIGLANAFNAFQHEFSRGNKSLADHDFWRYARICAQRHGSEHDLGKTP